jgi:DNA-binding response OmpR family regulator
MRLLIVDADEAFCQTLRSKLTEQRYTVDIAEDGETGLDFAASADYDLILLEVTLPKLDGFQVCRQLRSRLPQAWILFFSDRGSSTDKITGLEAGADDYLVKPMGLPELMARLRALRRRQLPTAQFVLEWGDLRFDLYTCEVTYANRPLMLTSKEYALLELFLRQPQRIFSQSSILQQVWSIHGELPGQDTVRSHIKRLRQKLKKIGADDLIETVYGLGYRLNAQFQKAAASANLSVSSSDMVVEHEHSVELFKEHLRDCAMKLEKKIHLWLAQPDRLDLQQQAEWESHKLIGSLGMLGLFRSTEITQQIQALLASPPDTPEQAALAQKLRSLQVAIDELESSPEQRTGHAQAPCARIMAVDDDVILLNLLQKILEPWGLSVTTLSNPLQFWDTLEAVQPDLLILDVQMPEIGGIELCQQVRDHNRWLWLPILFLTAQRDSQTVQKIFIAGADDYVNKPVLAPELIARLFNRLERTRLLRQ